MGGQGHCIIASVRPMFGSRIPCGGSDAGLLAHSNDYPGVLIHGTLIHIDAQGRGADKGALARRVRDAAGYGQAQRRVECLLLLRRPPPVDSGRGFFYRRRMGTWR